MHELIEKWKTFMEYKIDGLSVPEDKWQECAEWLEKAINERGLDICGQIHSIYSEGKTLGGWGETAVAAILPYFENPPTPDLTDTKVYIL
jgi:hypothetical protein